MSHYVLWDIDSGNVVGSYPNLPKALAKIDRWLQLGYSPGDLVLVEEPAPRRVEVRVHREPAGHYVTCRGARCHRAVTPDVCHRSVTEDQCGDYDGA